MEYRSATLSICNFIYNLPQKIPIVIHNGPKYDYHFIMKELAEEKKSSYPSGIIEQSIRSFLNKIHVPKKVIPTVPKK